MRSLSGIIAQIVPLLTKAFFYGIAVVGVRFKTLHTRINNIRVIVLKRNFGVEE